MGQAAKLSIVIVQPAIKVNLVQMGNHSLEVQFVHLVPEDILELAET